MHYPKHSANNNWLDSHYDSLSTMARLGPRLPIWLLLLPAFIAIGCAAIVEKQLDERWGAPSVKQRLNIANQDRDVPDFHNDIQPILDQRCVVCHACYDAPCQLKLSSFEGLERGANKKRVYNGTRLLADEPTRLFIDAPDTLAWRKKDYFPVINERSQTPEANLQGSVLYRMLKLKQAHPLPDEKRLPSEFDLGLARDQQCTTIETFDTYEDKYPLWGMPYGLPEIDAEHFETLESWLEAGAPTRPLAQAPEPINVRVDHWEAFFNQADTRSQLVSRYIYEHLFLARLYFSGIDEQRFFRLVRSSTPPGEPIREIASRRPFDHPGLDQFYYRLRPVIGSRVAKTHMPYALNGQRMKRWKALFFEPDYEVLSLPSYTPRSASNPFATFKDLPAKSRYQFMLDEAQFTIMGFIKGPVCRGQVALNVIDDHFWVMFVDPDIDQMLYESDIREDTIAHLSLPAEAESNALPTSVWTKYSRMQAAHLEDRLTYIKERAPNGLDISLDALWDGEGQNQNAALTIFRHFDSASVIKGFHGGQPKTAWVITYSLLERIHYLLVAGFDVYGNVGHQLNTRLYMDFLRMEGEGNFLWLLPYEEAEKQFEHWYRGAEGKVSNYLQILSDSGIRATNIPLSKTSPKSALFEQIRNRMGKAVLGNETVAHPQLLALGELPNHFLRWLPEVTMIEVRGGPSTSQFYTLIANRGHLNVSTLLLEKFRLVPEEDTLSVLPGIVGTYPNTFFSVGEDQLDQFIKGLSQVNNEADYSILRDTFGIRRTHPDFWQFADKLHHWYRMHQELEYGLLDFNRLENR